MSELFSALKQIDNNNYGFYDDLSDQTKAKIKPYVLLKWLAFSNDATKIKILNESANRYMFKLSKHPNLMARLLAVSGQGEDEFYKFISSDGKNGGFGKSIKTISAYHNISSNEANFMIDLYDCEEVIEMAEALGLHDYVKDIKREFK